MNYIKSLFVWFFYILVLIILYIPALLIWLVTLPFDRKLWLLHQYTCFWASVYTWISISWRVTIQGRGKIKPGKIYVLISNHQSILDILVMYRLFVHFKWVSKIELFKVPIIGWNMSANRYISLKRGKQSGILHMMNDSEKKIRNGSSVMIFAEGTRSLDQKIKAFKEGAFKLAVKTQTPIIPIVIDGTGEALPKKGFVFKGQHNITVNVLDEISVEGLEDKDVKSLISKVKGLMEEELQSIRKIR